MHDSSRRVWANYAFPPIALNSHWARQCRNWRLAVLPERSFVELAQQVDRLFSFSNGVGRVRVGLLTSSRRLLRLEGGDEVDGEFVVAGGACLDAIINYPRLNGQALALF